MIGLTLTALVVSATLPAAATLAQTAAKPEVAPATLAMEPHAVAALTIVNGRAVTAMTVAVMAEGETVRHAGPLASNAKVSVPLPTMRGCLVTVVVTFQDGSFLSGGETDVCKVKLVRLID